jgi:hypothetical protein
LQQLPLQWRAAGDMIRRAVAVFSSLNPIVDPYKPNYLDELLKLAAR